MASRFIYVTNQHPLSASRVHKYLRVGVKEVSSIKMAFYHLMVCQQEEYSIDREMRYDNTLINSPDEIAQWLHSHNIKVQPKWVFKVPAVYRDILVEQMQQEHSKFRKAFIDAVEEVDRPASIRFIVCSSQKEYVMSAGVRKTVAMDNKDFPGYNLYGDVLEDLLKMYLNGNFEYRFNINRLQTSVIKLKPKCPSTVLILSDSYCRQVEKVEGGTIISVSGGTFRDLATEVKLRGLRFGDYAFVVIHCGANDSQRDPQKWQELLEPMEKVIKEQKEDGCKAEFLISTAITLPTLTKATEHADWIENRLVGTGISCINWAKLIDNPFLVKHESLIVKVPDYWMLDADLFHVNHNGFLAMWSEWVEVFPKLRYVGYKLSPDRLSIKRDSHGNIIS